MTKRRDAYEILNQNGKITLTKDSDQKDVKKAYKVLAMKFHPDRNPSPEAADKMAEVNVAYAVLSDEDTRALYNKGGYDAVEGNSSGRSTMRDFKPPSMQDVMDSFSNGEEIKTVGSDTVHRRKGSSDFIERMKAKKGFTPNTQKETPSPKAEEPQKPTSVTLQQGVVEMEVDLRDLIVASLKENGDLELAEMLETLPVKLDNVTPMPKPAPKPAPVPKRRFNRKR